MCGWGFLFHQVIQGSMLLPGENRIVLQGFLTSGQLRREETKHEVMEQCFFKSQAFLPHPTDQDTFHSSPNSKGVRAQKEKETRVREHRASSLPPRTNISALITCVIRFCLATPPDEVKGTGVDEAGERGQGYGSSGCSGKWEGPWTQGPELSSETWLKDQQRTKVKWGSRMQDPDAEQKVCKRSGQSDV